ncbi:MAG: hypothetical protein QXS90_03075 [Candidatus Diapherotrites archaeon]
MFSRRKEIIAEIQEAEQNLAAKNKKRPNNKHEIINDLQGLRRQLNLVEFLLFGKKFW